MVPVTERLNSESEHLDGSLDALSFIRTLRAAERGLFAGYQSFPSLPDFSEQLERLADACRQQRLVVMSGCGTSGRLAFLTARRFGSWQFRYAIAGGDSALLLSDELPEDSPLQGRADLPSSECFVVGVSCGLSAPYVAGQLALSPRESAVIGFNPTSLARNNAVDALWPDGRKGSFRDLVGSVGHIINPVIGPEPVAGSSRMKGGTATLILLDVLCLRATNSALGRSAKDLLHEFEVAYSESYAQLVESLPPLMQAAGEALRAGGRLFYLGAGSAAIVGLIDLSEMPDTYGSPFDQSRAFIAGGWQTLGNVQGDLSRRSRLHRISLQDFRADLLNSLSEKDFVVALVSDDASESHVAELSALLADIGGKAKASCISVGSKKGQLAVSSSLHINLRPDCVIAAHDLAVKLALNAISTYAQAFGRGALFKGMMIACGPSNDKIYSRCLGMIRDCCKVSHRDAEIAMLKAIYRVNSIDFDQMMRIPRVDHIKASVPSEEKRHEPQICLPVAFLCAMGWTVEDASKAVLEQPLNVLLEQEFKREKRSPTLVALAMDVGGTNVRSALVNCANGRLVSQIFSEAVGSDRSPAAFLRVVDRVARCALEAGKKVDVVAIAQPGSHDRDGCIFKLAAFPNWGLEKIPIAATVARCFKDSPPSVHLFDDSESALAAEVFFGAGRLAQTVVTLTLGTGVGSAVSLRHGQILHRGARSLIEFGHSIVVPNGKLCSCGQHGCLEAYTSGPAIAAAASEASAEAVFASSAQYDGIICDAAEKLAVACINLVRAYDPNVICLTGNAGFATQMAQKVRDKFRELNWKLFNDAAHVPISLSSCVQSNLIGAAALAVRAGSNVSYDLRRATLEDLNALYEVCLKTGDSGADGTHLFSDPTLLGKIYVGPYVVLCPDHAFCLCDPDGKVVGYCLAADDTRSFNVKCMAEWWPLLRLEYAAKRGLMRANENALLEEKIFGNQTGGVSLNEEQLAMFPSHMHIDLIASAQNHGFGGVMVERLLDTLRGVNKRGVHLTMSSQNAKAFKFYSKLGFDLAVKGADEWILTKNLV